MRDPMSTLPPVVTARKASRRAPYVLFVPLACAATVFFAGCGRDQIASYEAPKDSPAPPPPSASPHGAGGAGGMMAGGPEARPGLRWKELPAGWTERGASGLRVANFSLAGTQGGAADLAVIPLPGTGGSDLDLVNLWRGPLGLAPITEAQLPKHVEQADLAGQPYKIFSIVGSEPADASAASNQVVVVALRRENFTWFFKLAGDAPSVEAHRANLRSFIASAEFTAPAIPANDPHAFAAGGPSPAGGPPASGSDGTPSPTWQAPADWKAVPPTQMVHSKWSVPAATGAPGEVAVSVFRGEAGGLVPNLNRWRAKVGLPPAPDAELQALAGNFVVDEGKGTLVDFTGSETEGGTPSRLVGAIVGKDGWTWYYRLTGTPALVEAQRAAFVNFVKSARYSPGA